MTVSSATYYIDNDAVVFVKDGSKYSVTTGSKLKATTTPISDIYYVAADANSTTGFRYVKLAYVASSALGSSTEKYAYVTGDVVKYQDPSDKTKFYVEIPVGDTTLTTKATTSDPDDVVSKAYGLAKGGVFTYTLNADGKVDTISAYTMGDLAASSGAITTGATAAIVAVESKDIVLSNDYFINKNAADTAATRVGAGHTYSATLTDDSVIIYVNSSDNTVAEGGSIVKASSNVVSSTTSNYANAKVVTNSNTEVLLLVVDVNNDILNIQ